MVVRKLSEFFETTDEQTDGFLLDIIVNARSWFVRMDITMHPFVVDSTRVPRQTRRVVGGKFRNGIAAGVQSKSKSCCCCSFKKRQRASAEAS